MIRVTIVRTSRCPVSNAAIRAVVSAAAREVAAVRDEVVIHVVGERLMRRLNREYRGVDSVTDVLSFGWRTGHVSRGPMGELYLNYGYIARQAKRFGVTARNEFCRMIVHGLLHLVGYDHVHTHDASIMFGKQEKILQKVVM